MRVDGRAKPGRRKEADGREPTPPSPVGVGGGGRTAGRPRSSVKGSSWSMPVGTRKMVNYA